MRFTGAGERSWNGQGSDNSGRSQSGVWGHLGKTGNAPNDHAHASDGREGTKPSVPERRSLENRQPACAPWQDPTSMGENALLFPVENLYEEQSHEKGSAGCQDRFFDAGSRPKVRESHKRQHTRPKMVKEKTAVPPAIMGPAQACRPNRAVPG